MGREAFGEASQISEAYLHDVVDVSRQALSNLFREAYLDLLTIYRHKDTTKEQVKMKSSAMLSMIQDMDRILETSNDFLLGKWIENAKRLAGNEKDEGLLRYYEYQARNQITTWGSRTINNDVLNDYASKLWSGLVGEYYYDRWTVFLAEMVRSKGLPSVHFDSHRVNLELDEVEMKFQYSRKKYPSSAKVDDTIKVAKELYAKYVIGELDIVHSNAVFESEAIAERGNDFVGASNL